METYPGKERAGEKKAKTRDSNLWIWKLRPEVYYNQHVVNGWWLIFEHGVWGGKKLARNQKRLSSWLKTNLKVFPSCPWKQKTSCGFRQRSCRRASGEGYPLTGAGRPTGLSVYRETDVTYTAAPFMRGHQWPEKLLDAMHLFQIQKYREDIYWDLSYCYLLPFTNEFLFLPLFIKVSFQRCQSICARKMQRKVTKEILIGNKGPCFSKY